MQNSLTKQHIKSNKYTKDEVYSRNSKLVCHLKTNVTEHINKWEKVFEHLNVYSKNIR